MTLKQIPNALCVLRIALVAPLLWSIVTQQFVVATLLFGFAGFTDILDGYLARRYDWHSSLGAVLDPVADKLLTVGVFVSLIVVGLIPRWLAYLVIGRDVLIVCGVVAFRTLIGPLAAGARFAGKANTAVMLLFVLLLLARVAVGYPGERIVMTVGAILVATVLVSGFDYMCQWIAQARHYKPRKEEARSS